ncbi:homoserine O-succinyltransferase MetA [Thiofilum flexile]|uniref:homoserine O-succinyltransferase MetA n=1 Tax=Thiofilum flexile TaxID=125627 RepID=UPI00037533E3|nr:homoserine O-succinyltransferase [Thiofilum flexile]
MPVVAHSQLPAFERLREEGHVVLDESRAAHQDIRELHIGLLNMMPDAALMATERQFIRLISASNLIAQFHVHVFTLPSIVRGEKARAYIEQYYETFADLRREGLDALILSGAAPVAPNLNEEPYWQELVEVIEWANEHVTTTLCSCLATHAVVEHLYGLKRQRLPEGKCWGVFSHTLTAPEHPLISNLNTQFDTPHSRFNDVSRAAFESKGLKVLVESQKAGVHIAVSPDLFRWIFLQGHPEYDRASLLKEYKRDITRWHAGQYKVCPPIPYRMLDERLTPLLNDFAHRVADAKINNSPMPDLPETLLWGGIHNTWGDTAKALFSNWIGKMYQVTHHERNIPFMAGIDPHDPLGLIGK